MNQIKEGRSLFFLLVVLSILFLLVSVKLIQASTGTLTLYDPNGNQVTSTSCTLNNDGSHTCSDNSDLTIANIPSYCSVNGDYYVEMSTDESGSACNSAPGDWSNESCNGNAAYRKVYHCDKVPPSTTISPDGSSWTNSDVNFSLSCSDDSSGCNATYYDIISSSGSCPSAGDSAYSSGTSGTVSCGSGSVCEESVCYYSVDNAGNVESVHKSNVFYIDKVAPSTSASGVKSDGSSYTFGSWTSSSYVNVTLSCSDSGSGCSGVKYCVDTSNSCSPSTDYSGPVHITTEGVSYIRYFSTDNAGNSESTKSETIKIDTTAPSTSASAVDAVTGSSYTFGNWIKDDVNVTLSCSDSGSGCSGIKYCVDTSNSCTPSTDYSGVFQVSCSSGSACVKYVRYFSTDNVGNQESVKSEVVRLDKAPPTYNGYSDVSGYDYEDGNVYWVKGGDTFNITISHSDVGSGVYRQYFGFNKDACSPNGCGGAPYEIKSYTYGDGIVHDWTANDSYINIESAKCVDSDGSCSDNDMSIEWSSYVNTSCPEWDYYLNTYEYDRVHNGYGYTALGVWVKVDNTPPSTSASGVKSDGSSYSFGSWTSSSYVNVSLSCSDSRSGCDKTYYCTDTSNSCTPGTVYSGPVKVSTEGVSYIRFYSVDHVGHADSVKSEVIKIDTTAPSTTINPDGHDWTDENVSFTLSCSDSGSGCAGSYYKIINDGDSCGSSGFNSGSSGTVTCPSDSVCKKRVCYYSKDNVNNQESVKLSNIFYIDTTTPITSASGVKNDSSSYAFDTWTNSAYVNVTLTVTSGGGSDVHTYYCVDTSNSCTPSTEYSSPIHVSGDNVWYVRFFSNNTAGNKESTKSVIVKIDTIKPTTNASAVKSDGSSYSFGSWTNSPYVNVTLSCSDSGSGCNKIYYCVDTSNSCIPSSVYSSPVHITTEGVSYIKYYAVDNANNTESVNSKTIKIDTASPSCSISSISESSAYSFVSGDTIYYNNVASGSFSVGVSSSDSLSGVSNVSFPSTTSSGGVDSSSPYSWTYNWDSSDSSDYSPAVVHCYDNAGNSNSANFNVLLDNQPPSGGFVAYPNSSNNPWVIVNVSAGSDARSGVASTQLYYRHASYDGSSCGSWSSYSAYGSENPLTSQVNVSNLQTGCYQFIYESADNVDNSINYTSSTTLIINVPPLTLDDSPSPIFWFIDDNPTINLTCTNNNGLSSACNRTYYCVYDLGTSPCSDFSTSYDSLTHILVSCSQNSACEKAIRYYSVSDTGAVESVKESNPVDIVWNSTVNNTNAYLCNITDGSYVKNGFCGNCYIENSVLINSSVLGLVGRYRYHCRIVNSTLINVNLTNSEVYNSYVDPSVLVDSLIENSTIINSSIKSSTVYNSNFSYCGWFNVTSASIVSSVLTGGVIVHNGNYYYSPKNLSSICSNISPSPKGYVVASPNVVRNSTIITVYYHAPDVGYSVILNESPLNSGVVNLLDDGVAPDEVKDDGIYTANFTVNNLSTGLVTLFLSVEDDLGNSFTLPFTVFLDNELPNASLLINGGDNTTISPRVLLSLNYSDNYKVSYCQLSNDNVSWSNYSCQPTIAWRITNLTNGLKTVYLRVFDVAGNYVEVNDSINLMLGAVDLTPPTNLTVWFASNWTNSNNSLTCYWHAFDRESKVFYYYRIPELTNWVYAGQSESAVIKNLSLTEGETYHCEVIAQNSYFVNSSPVESDGITVDLTPPVVSSLNSSVVNNSWTNKRNMCFNWSAYDPTHAGVSSGVFAYSYLLSRNENAVPDEIPEGDLNNLSGATSYCYSNLIDGVNYFKVDAEDVAGNWGSPAVYVVKVDTIPPTAPYMKSPTQNASQGSITFSWEPSSDPDPYGVSSGVAYYIINITYVANGSVVKVAQVSGTNYTFTGAKNNVSYHASVSAVDNAGNVGRSSDSIKTFDNKPPAFLFKKPFGTIISLFPIIKVRTDETATCYYNNTPFDFTNSTYHVVRIGVQNGRSYNIQIRCSDLAGNVNITNLSFNVDVENPTHLGAVTYSNYFTSSPMVITAFLSDSNSVGLGEAPDRFKLELNGSTYNFVVDDVGGGYYNLTLLAPPVPGTYDMKLYYDNLTVEKTIAVHPVGLSVSIEAPSVSAKKYKNLAEASLNGVKVGLASDSPIVHIETSSSNMALNSTSEGQVYIFATNPNSDVAARQVYLQNGRFSDLARPSFGYPISVSNYFINSLFNYNHVVIINNLSSSNGLNRIVIKNLGYDKDGNVIIELTNG